MNTKYIVTIITFYLAFAISLSGQSKRDLKKMQKEQTRKEEAAKIKQRQEELNGSVKTGIIVLETACGDLKKNLKIALLPFKVVGESEVDMSYSPQNALRDYFTVYAGKLGWTVIGRERTNSYLGSLEDLVMANVYEEEEINSLKDQIGADVLITGNITEFKKGTHGSSGSHVSFTARCQYLETHSEHLWDGDLVARSGAYNYDKSPVFLLQEAIKEFFTSLQNEIQTKCSNTN